VTCKPVIANILATQDAKKLAKVKVGVLGCGYWGPKLVRNFNQLDEAEITMACDLRADRLQYIRNLYPGTVTTSNFKDLLHSNLDAIVIATPVNTHYPLAKLRLKLASTC
jgi:predicted dehydrogenase